MAAEPVEAHSVAAQFAVAEQVVVHSVAAQFAAAEPVAVHSVADDDQVAALIVAELSKVAERV